MSREFNRKGYHPPEIVDSQACVNCGLCEMICPEFAIFCIEPSDSVGLTAESSVSAGSGTGEVRP
jgi:2-oxoglutarate ferredoxin oxidoreductase subunit delta